MPRTKKPRLGRPPLGDAARSRIVTIKLTGAEYDAIVEAVAKENAGVEPIGEATVASWFRAAAELAIARWSTR